MAHGQARARAGRGDEECGNAKTKEKGALLSHARHTKGGGFRESNDKFYSRAHRTVFILRAQRKGVLREGEWRGIFGCDRLEDRTNGEGGWRGTDHGMVVWDEGAGAS